MCATENVEECGAIMNYVHSAASIANKEAKARMKGKKKEVTTISQRAAQIVEGAHTKEKEDFACPRCDRELLCLQHRFGTDPTLSWMDSRRNTVYADQSVPQLLAEHLFSTQFSACVPRYLFSLLHSAH